MRIAAACAAVGLAVAAVLLLVLRFVVGRSVLDGVGSPVGGLPRRYADYLPSGGATSVDDIRVLTVVLGTGLAAGLLIGLLVATVRRTVGAGRPLPAMTVGLSGLVVGVLLAVVLHVYGGRFAGGGGDLGWYAYSPLRSDGVLYGGGAAPSSWPLVLTGSLAGLAVGTVATGAVALRARLRASTSPSG